MSDEAGTDTHYTLFHAHDPMCSWCWGFKKSWLAVSEALPSNVKVRLLLGGLAPDSDDPMPTDMRAMLQGTWQRIAQTIPGTEFNHDFWTKNEPRRSTFPSCRAVIAARRQSEEFEVPMIQAIQEAYYLNAKNPSDHEVLAEIAESVGCDKAVFSAALNSDSVFEEHDNERSFAARIGAQGFPSLFLATPDHLVHPVGIDYNNPGSILEQIDVLIPA